MEEVMQLKRENVDALDVCSGCGSKRIACSPWTDEIYCMACGLVLL